MKVFRLFFIVVFLLQFKTASAQVGTNGNNRSEEGRPIKEYSLTIEKNKVTLGGVTSHGMTINGSIPGPVLEFTEGDLAIINVTNKMDVETSVHWHGLILPNFYDGVPYLTTPPIKPGTTFQYRIPLNQSGTYWYHSHTMLQEQKGVYGSIVIQPKEKKLDYDKDLVIVLSDWTNENPKHVLRNLKRRNEWYQIKKKTAVPLSRAIAQGGFAAQLKMWRDRMEGADIADIYYPTFLSNGQQIATYAELKAGEKVRLRLINASASTYFWMDFGGGNPMLISSDGVDTKPVHKNRFLFTIAETYDFIITIPEGKLEITATAQDGSGYTSIQLGSGHLMSARKFERPDKVEMMKAMAKMDMKMGAPSIIGNKKKNTPAYLMEKYGMKMDHDMMNMGNEMNHDEHQNHEMKENSAHDQMQHQEMDHSKMNHQQMNHKEMNHDQHQNHQKENMQMSHEQPKDTSSFDYAARQKYFNYDFLEAKQPTVFNKNIPVNEMLLNLTGNMNRYVWSLNGIPLNETDKIKIKQGEITRITFNNLTMMHHPMHLHGHYFRVINKNGERSPLKHTVNVPPMQKVTIEFYNEEVGDWFFHCHVLYHMMSGMTRVFSYDTPRDERMKAYDDNKIIEEANKYYSWGLAEVASNFSELNLITTNIRNEFSLRAEGDYKENLEVEVGYNYYLNDWVRVYAGVNTENEIEDSYEEFNTVAVAGIKYFTPYMFNVDLSLDHQLRPRIRASREFLLFPRFFVEGEYEYRADFGVVNDLGTEDFIDEHEWLVRGEYMLSRNFSLQANYQSHFGFGGGLTIRF